MIINLFESSLKHPLLNCDFLVRFTVIYFENISIHWKWCNIIDYVIVKKIDFKALKVLLKQIDFLLMINIL